MESGQSTPPQRSVYPINLRSSSLHAIHGRLKLALSGRTKGRTGFANRVEEGISHSIQCGRASRVEEENPITRAEDAFLGQADEPSHGLPGVYSIQENRFPLRQKLHGFYHLV